MSPEGSGSGAELVPVGIAGKPMSGERLACFTSGDKLTQAVLSC